MIVGRRIYDTNYPIMSYRPESIRVYLTLGAETCTSYFQRVPVR